MKVEMARLFYFAIFAAVVAVLACSGATPTPAPTATPFPTADPYSDSPSNCHTTANGDLYASTNGDPYASTNGDARTAQ